MELTVLLQAQIDSHNIYVDLENKEDGRGEQFLEELDTAFEALLTNPEIAPIYRSGWRRKLFREYGYGVFYKVYPTRLAIGTIQNLKRDPRRIQEILKRLN